MCRRVQCSKCHKATFAGCGAHVEQVLAGVPAADRCRCGQADAAAPPGPSSTAPAPSRGLRWPWQK